MFKKILTTTFACLILLSPGQVLAYDLVSGSESDLCTAPTFSDQFEVVGKFYINYVLLPGHEKFEFRPDQSEYQKLPLSNNQGLNKIISLKMSDWDAVKIPADRVVKIKIGNYKAFCEGSPQADYLGIDQNFANIQGSFTLISGIPDDLCSNPAFLGEEMISGQFTKYTAENPDGQAVSTYGFILDDDQRARLPLFNMQTSNPVFNREVYISNSAQTASFISGKLNQPSSVIVDRYAASCISLPSIRLKTTFSDVPAKNAFSDEIQLLKSLNIISGYGDGTFKPEKYISRAEFTKIILSSILNEEDFLAPDNCFSDVNKDAWYSRYICTAKTADIIGGYPDNTFKPMQTITLAEVLKIVLKVNGINYKETAVWHEGIIAKAQEQGIVTFAPITPEMKITRAQMADIIAETIRKRNANY